MRFGHIMVAATAIVSASALAHAAPGQATRSEVQRPRGCSPTAMMIGNGGKEVRARKLGELPPASAIATVYNRVDGCPQPVVLRRGIGGGSDARDATPPRAR